MSCRNVLPRVSSATLPEKATRALRLAAAAHVLAADPPLLICPGGIFSLRYSARSRSISIIAPLRISCLERNASSAGATMSTIALPMPRISKRGESVTAKRSTLFSLRLPYHSSPLSAIAMISQGFSSASVRDRPMARWNPKGGRSRTVFKRHKNDEPRRSESATDEAHALDVNVPSEPGSPQMAAFRPARGGSSSHPGSPQGSDGGLGVPPYRPVPGKETPVGVRPPLASTPAPG